MTILTDSLTSVYTALGQKSEAIKYTSKRISDAQLLAAYEQSWLVQKFIDKTIEDMLKVPREFTGEYNQDLITTALNKELRLNVAQVKADFLTWSSLLGDALIVAITDCDDMSSECDVNEDVKRFIVLTKGEYTPSKENTEDLLSANFGKPVYYKIKTGEMVHHSRCHRLKLGKNRLTDKRQFGMSDLQNKLKSSKLFDTTITCIFDLIQDSNVDVLFLPEMMSRVSAGGESDIVKFIELVKLTKSSTNMLVLDAGTPEAQGRWEQKQANYSGLSEVLTKLVTVTAGTFDRPITVLFGESASGFSTGEEDLESYHGTINALQESRLRPAQEFIDKFILNKIMDMDNVEYIYPPIKVVDEDKEAARFTSFSTGLSALITSQIITDKVAQNELLARGLLINTKKEDFEDGNLFKSSEYS